MLPMIVHMLINVTSIFKPSRVKHNNRRGSNYGTIASKITVTPKGVRLSEKLQLTAALCNEI